MAHSEKDTLIFRMRQDLQSYALQVKDLGKTNAILIDKLNTVIKIAETKIKQGDEIVMELSRRVANFEKNLSEILETEGKFTEEEKEKYYKLIPPKIAG